MRKRIVVTGSRDWDNREVVADALHRARKDLCAVDTVVNHPMVRAAIEECAANMGFAADGPSAGLPAYGLMKVARRAALVSRLETLGMDANLLVTSADAATWVASGERADDNAGETDAVAMLLDWHQRVTQYANSWSARDIDQLETIIRTLGGVIE